MTVGTKPWSLNFRTLISAADFRFWILDFGLVVMVARRLLEPLSIVSHPQWRARRNETTRRLTPHPPRRPSAPQRSAPPSPPRLRRSPECRRRLSRRASAPRHSLAWCRPGPCSSTESPLLRGAALPSPTQWRPCPSASDPHAYTL